ncbi:phosphotransferase [Oerskovia flava]|uniref:phosphotransferase n=1 Tax=Oerskovia flava TaxID=2986422 RepID=UPI00223F82C6|nr:phosphotransferase [Oerskovia sp. JB1-3-2]
MTARSGSQGARGTDDADEVGIRRLSAVDPVWSDVPTVVRQTVRRATSAVEVVDAMTDETSGWSTELVRSLLHPASGGAAVLVPPPTGRALVLGSGRHTLAPALELLGADVTRADWVYDRLRFQQLMHPTSGGLAHLDLRAPLPWDGATFDLVWLDVDAVRSELGPSGATRVLTEVGRVLDRQAVVVVDTRHAGRRAIDAARRGSPGRVRGSSTRRLLAHARVAQASVHVAVPDRDSWDQLVPAERLAGALAAGDQRSGLKRVLSTTLRTLGGAGLLAPDRVVVAHRTDGGAPRLSVAELAAGSPRAPVDALSDARVAVAGSRFVKIPLSVDQHEALAQEVANTTAARSTTFAPFTLEGVRLDDVGPVRVARYPVVRATEVDLDRAEHLLVDILDAQDSTTLAPLHSTALWTRLRSPRALRDCDEIGASALRERVLQDLGDVVVPVGATHGDLHPDNLLVPRSGQPLLVDWNRFEPYNPLFLDPAYAAVQLARASGGTLGEALLAIASGELDGPLVGRAADLRGELDAFQMVSVVLLDRVVSYSLPRRRYKPWTLPPLRDAVAAISTWRGDRSGHVPS